MQGKVLLSDESQGVVAFGLRVEEPLPGDAGVGADGDDGVGLLGVDAGAEVAGEGAAFFREAPVQTGHIGNSLDRGHG